MAFAARGVRVMLVGQNTWDFGLTRGPENSGLRVSVLVGDDDTVNEDTGHGQEVQHGMNSFHHQYTAVLGSGHIILTIYFRRLLLPIRSLTAYFPSE